MKRKSQLIRLLLFAGLIQLLTAWAPYPANAAPSTVDDPELDQTEFFEVSPEDHPRNSIHEIQEAEILNPFTESLTLSVGTFRNISNFSFSNDDLSYGTTFTYSTEVGRDVFVLDRGIEDSMDLELGFVYYSRVNVDFAQDSYQILPILGQFRYNLNLSKTFAFITYLGFQYNWIVGAQKATVKTFESLQGIQPNFGIGALLTLGPHWYLRTDIGIDKLALGLALRW